MEKKQKIIVVCGKKNSGKTTLLIRLISRLTEQGRKVAVIKHDGHDFAGDIPGTDSYRLKQAGAYGTVVYSRSRVLLYKDVENEQAASLIEMFPEAEIIFIEGLKNSSYPKIEVIRKEVSDQLVSNPEGRFLIVTDWEKEKFKEPAAGFDEIDFIIETIEKSYNS